MKHYQEMNIEELRDDIIRNAKKAYPLFISGAIYWLAMGVLGLFIEGKPMALIYILGSSSIFPLGILIGKMLRVDIISSKNPLGVVGGLVGGIQAFFIPLWIIIYMEHFEWIPMVVAVMGGAHFLPYVWIYKSKAYVFQTVATVLVGFVFGYVTIHQAFLLVPFSLTAVYAVTAIGLVAESKRA